MATPIEVVPYDPSWPRLFDEVRRDILRVLGSRAVRVEHVGSTAIAETDAKPVVDIQLSVESFEPFGEILGPLESIGLTYRETDWPQHRFFFNDQVHVHVCEVGSSWEREHLLFRDYLRNHPQNRDRYVELKKRVALVHRDDRMAYTDAKEPIVLEILAAAESWAKGVGWQVDPAV